MSRNQNKQAFFEKRQILLMGIIVILLIVAVLTSLPKKEESQPSQLIIPDITEIEIINSSGEIPQTPLIGENRSKSNFPQQGPATIQDLGGNTSPPISIEDLLKDKTIEISK